MKILVNWNLHSDFVNDRKGYDQMDNAVTSTLQNIPNKVPWFCRTLRSTQGSSLREIKAAGA